MTAVDRIRSVAERHELAWIAVDRLLGALVFLGTVAAAIALAVAVTACGPAAGSPNCPPVQWYVDVPGSGWACKAGSASVFTPGYTSAPSPAATAP